MSQQELMASLQRAAEQEIAALWQATEQEAQRLRDQAQQQQQALRNELLSAAQRQAAKQAAARDQLALRQERSLRLDAEAALAERLLRLARELLPQLRGGDDRQIFTALTAELPPVGWGVLRVHPGDLPLARQLFPEVEITGDQEISGGLEAVSADGGLRVVNTLEKRLQRLWPQLLSQLRKEVYAILDRPGTA